MKQGMQNVQSRQEPAASPRGKCANLVASEPCLRVMRADWALVISPRLPSNPISTPLFGNRYIDELERRKLYKTEDGENLT